MQPAQFFYDMAREQIDEVINAIHPGVGEGTCNGMDHMMALQAANFYSQMFIGAAIVEATEALSGRLTKGPVVPSEVGFAFGKGIADLFVAAAQRQREAEEAQRSTGEPTEHLVTNEPIAYEDMWVSKCTCGWADIMPSRDVAVAASVEHVRLTKPDESK